MKKSELEVAMGLAKSPKYAGIDFATCIETFAGFVRPEFQPISIPLRHLVSLLRFHALQFDGNWNQSNLDEIAKYGKKKFDILS